MISYSIICLFGIMNAKDLKKSQKSSSPDHKSSTYGESDDTYVTPSCVGISLQLEDKNAKPGDWNFLAIFNGQVILEGKWQNDVTLKSETLPLNLRDPYSQMLIADRPLIFLLRAIGGKGFKDPDPLLNLDNRAGGNVDLLPLLLGEDLIFTKVPLLLIATGQSTGCSVVVRAEASGSSDITSVPLLITMVSAHCLPFTKEGTVYLGAIGFDGILDPLAVNFGMSLSNNTASKIVWASASNAGHAANTLLNIPNDDKYVPNDFEPKETSDCNSVYWNAMKRVLVDSTLLRSRLSTPFLVEVAGVPRMGKIDLRGRYMGFVDAAALLEPGQYGVTTCTKLLFYSEAELPEYVGPLLDLPPSSAKVSARESDLIRDEYGHNAYVTIRFDLIDVLTPKTKMALLFETLGFPAPDGAITSVNELIANPPVEDPLIDVRRISKEGGALAVHKEISNLACRGAVPMNQSIKRTAANRLLMRVRSMLKQFSPGECSSIEWQDIVTGQHAASRRAVTSSFAPQPPPLRAPLRVAAARCRIAGDGRIADEHIKTDLKVAAGHPKSLLSKTLRCLEEWNDKEARQYLLQALSAQTRNRYLLWIYGGQEFDKGAQALESAAAAFRIAVKGCYSDGTSNAIGWAALHALHHFNQNTYAAFVAAKKMRKSYELIKEWKKFLYLWVDTSGEEEVFWVPEVVSSHNPMVIASAFFLCLRCYKFCDRLLKCVEDGCATRGSRLNLKTNVSPDIYYLRAASYILRRNLDKAMEVTQQGIKKFGPSAIMSQMRATCLAVSRGWDGDCEDALEEAERAGALPCPALLIQAALGGLKTNPYGSLQRAARAHKIAPCGHSALVIARIYFTLGDMVLAQRWAAAAVKWEPLLADGWAVLAMIAIHEMDVEKGRAMLRTAKQVGPLNSDIEEELNKIMKMAPVESLPDFLMKDICFCDYY